MQPEIATKKIRIRRLLQSDNSNGVDNGAPQSVNTSRRMAPIALNPMIQASILGEETPYLVCFGVLRKK